MNLLSKIDDSPLLDFIDYSISRFYLEIENYETKTKRTDKYHPGEYGEMALVNFYSNGIIRNHLNKEYLVVNEFEITDQSDNFIGRADLIVEDFEKENLFIIEAKKINSKENEPESNDWNVNETEKYYDRVLEQASKYLTGDKHNSKEFKNIYLIAMVFSSVGFKSDKYRNDWQNFKPQLNNEFYRFEIYKKANRQIGLACYGYARKTF